MSKKLPPNYRLNDNCRRCVHFLQIPFCSCCDQEEAERCLLHDFDLPKDRATISYTSTSPDSHVCDSFVLNQKSEEPSDETGKI